MFAAIAAFGPLARAQEAPRPAAQPDPASAEPWPIRWTPGDSFDLIWTLDGTEETAQTVDGEARTTKHMESQIRLRGSVLEGDAGGVNLTIEFARVKLVATTSAGEAVYDNEREPDPARGATDRYAAGARMMGEALVGLRVWIALDAAGRVLEITGNEHLDSPRSLADKAGAAIAGDHILIPSLFPLFGAGEPLARPGCAEYPLFWMELVSLVMDSCIVVEEEGGVTTLAISGEGEPRPRFAPNAPPANDEPAIGPCSVAGRAVLRDGVLVASELTRKFGIGIDVSAFTGREGDMAWRSYEYVSRLRRME
jgi:hypothetical protein